MSYTAKSLDEIAAIFDTRAVACQHRANGVTRTARDAAKADGEATAWLQAAHILRRTTLTEPCHMETVREALEVIRGEL